MRALLSLRPGADLLVLLLCLVHDAMAVDETCTGSHTAPLFRHFMARPYPDDVTRQPKSKVEVEFYDWDDAREVATALEPKFRRENEGFSAARVTHTTTASDKYLTR
jgi:hypothetical protein